MPGCRWRSWYASTASARRRTTPGARERRDQGRPVPKTVTPSAKRQVAEVLVKEHRLPIRRACQIVKLSRAAFYRTPQGPMERDREIVEARRGTFSLSSQYTRYTRVKRKVPQRLRQPLAAPAVLNGTWALDFMHDALYGGRRFRTLNVLDEGNRQGLGIDIGTSIPSARAVRLMEQLIEVRDFL
jgi:putative transposase